MPGPAEWYLTKQGFVPSGGSYYFPGTNHPHLHAGVRNENSGYFTASIVTRIDARTGIERSRQGEPQALRFQTLDFMSYHLAGEPRAKHIWSVDQGWAAAINQVVAELRNSGLYPVCWEVLTAFACTRDTLPDAFT